MEPGLESPGYRQVIAPRFNESFLGRARVLCDAWSSSAYGAGFAGADSCTRAASPSARGIGWVEDHGVFRRETDEDFERVAEIVPDLDGHEHHVAVADDGHAQAFGAEEQGIGRNGDRAGGVPGIFRCTVA